jgi:Zn-dependent M16 (insulinase) family peptidase
LQGVEPGNTAAVEKLILDKLAELADSGFTAGAIEAAVNTIEFSLRENNTGSFPRGLSLMLRAVGAWIYGRDPYTPIQVRTALNAPNLRVCRDTTAAFCHAVLLLMRCEVRNNCRCYNFATT